MIAKKDNKPVPSGLRSCGKQSVFAKMWANKDCYLFMSGFLIVFFTFIILPVLSAMGLGFTYFNGMETPYFIGLNNYKNLFLNDPVFLKGLQNTFIISIIVGPAGYVLCLLFAWLINDLPPRLRALMTLLCYAPSISGGAILIWTIIFSGDAYGYLNAFLYKFGFINSPVQWLNDARYMMAICIMILLWSSLGVSFLTFIAGLQGVDRSLYEAGAVDGIKNRWQELWFITLPSIKPQLLFGAVMSITYSFEVGDVITQLFLYPSTDYAVHTLVNHMQDYGGLRFETGYACAIATLMFAMMVFSNQIFQRLLKKVGT